MTYLQVSRGKRLHRNVCELVQSSLSDILHRGARHASDHEARYADCHTVAEQFLEVDYAVSIASVFLISESLCCQIASLLLPSAFDLIVRCSILESTSSVSSGYCFVQYSRWIFLSLLFSYEP